MFLPLATPPYSFYQESTYPFEQVAINVVGPKTVNLGDEVEYVIRFNFNIDFRDPVVILKISDGLSLLTDNFVLKQLYVKGDKEEIRLKVKVIKEGAHQIGVRIPAQALENEFDSVSGLTINLNLLRQQQTSRKGPKITVPKNEQSSGPDTIKYNILIIKSQTEKKRVLR